MDSACQKRWVTLTTSSGKSRNSSGDHTPSGAEHPAHYWCPVRSRSVLLPLLSSRNTQHYSRGGSPSIISSSVTHGIPHQNSSLSFDYVSLNRGFQTGSESKLVLSFKCTRSILTKDWDVSQSYQDQWSPVSKLYLLLLTPKGLECPQIKGAWHL